MDELHSNFDKLDLDESGLSLKLDLPLKNQLIKKIRENSQLLADKQDKIEENNKLISKLDSLPVLIEDGNCK